jgi:hypothetical protein
LVKERNVLHTEKHIMRQTNRRFISSERISKVKIAMNRTKQVLGERRAARYRETKKERSRALIRSERDHLRAFISEFLLRKGPQSYAQIGAAVCRDSTRARVADSYGGVRPFCRKQMGVFSFSEVEDKIEYRQHRGGEWVTGTQINLNESVVTLRPIVAARLALDPPAIEGLANCWTSGLGLKRKSCQ